MMSQKRHMLPLFSGLTLFLAFAVHWRSWRGPRPAWLCGSFSGWLKPGSQSLTHRKSVRTIEVTLDRSASWQAELHRLLHQVVVGDEEGAAVQWGARGRWRCSCCGGGSIDRSASGSQSGCSAGAAEERSPRRGCRWRASQGGLR